MTIHIEDLTFDVIIGLLDFERDKPQRVIINLQASYDYNGDQFIDYADMVLLIQNELKEKRYELLENALTTKINDREMFMKGIDYSYYYEEND